MDWQKAKKDREEYFEKLRKWLDDARLWYSLSASTGSNTLSGLQFPLDGSQGQSSNIPHNQQNPYAAFYQIPPADQNQEGHILNNEQFPNADLGNNLENNNAFNRVPFYQTYPFILPPNLLRLPTTYEFKIPPLWKRLCAEIIDFCVLFTLKLALTFVFMESFSVGSALYGLDMIQKGLLEDQEVNLPLAFELMFLEALHKLVVLFFETYFLHGKTCATPGKRCMGLMVVQVEGLNLIPNRPIETVSATGVKALGWQRAFLRSTLKNLIVGLLLPLCLTFYVFPFNRTSYDMMFNTIVVEAHPEFLLYQALIIR
ncbi:protein FAM8A1 isoform X1 [Euwallacea similis]|uniref:protein FAM8A1 isoform X1 n=1 Tax=Euwallacea similis TaxID=1736056 RepID=UPI00344E96C3